MNLLEGCHSLKLECALRDLGFVDVGWKTIANAGIFIMIKKTKRNNFFI